MSNIEEDIMSEEAFNELIDNFEIVGTLTEYGRKAIKQNVKNLQKRIKELEEENKLLLNGKVGADLSYDNYIPVQKVNDKIERYEYMLAETIHGEIQKYTPGEILLKIDTLKELLEDK